MLFFGHNENENGEERQEDAMHYLYDIWVNWVDGEEDGLFIYPYYEWRKSDQIELVEQIPLLYVDEMTFYQIENSLQELPRRLLHSIYKRTYLRVERKRQLVDYACVVTDGIGIVAFHTLGQKMPLRKSRLIPRQEQQVYDLLPRIKKQYYHITKHAWDKMKHYKNIDTYDMIGLSRRERQMKRILLIAIDQLKRAKDEKEIYYWISEWENKNLVDSIAGLSLDVIWQQFYEQVTQGWSEKHEHFCRQIVKRNPILYHYFKQEKLENKNKENQK